MRDIAFRHIGQYILIAVTAFFGINFAVFPLMGGNSLTQWHLPYAETFDYIQQLEYRPFGGHWEVQDGVLLQTVENDTDLMAVIPVQLDPGQPYRFQTKLDFRSGQYGGGLMFNLQDTNSRQQSQVVRFGSANGQSYLVYGYFDEQQAFVPQGTITPYDLAQTANGVDLAVQVAETTYDIFVNGSAVATEIPLAYAGGQLALTTWFSQVAFDNISIDLLTSEDSAPQFVATPVPQSGSIVAAFSDSFDGAASQNQWQPLKGSWTFEPGTLVQSNPKGVDYGISHEATYEQFILRVQFSHREGVGAGVMFNMPQADSLNDAQIVRYQDENNLVWGYFDSEGVFQQQGNLAVTAPETLSHILEIATNGSSYGIMLDGRPVTVGIPLHSTSGFIGLSASNTVAAFEQVELFTGSRPTSGA
jgi:hypothetical protein